MVAADHFLFPRVKVERGGGGGHLYDAGDLPEDLGYGAGDHRQIGL
jgi:hypothetical protein